jgi:hypothetical protein
MQWFKHFTTAHNDNSLKKVRMKFGAEGYALYWYCLELIAGNINSDNVTFELEHDAEVIGYDLKIDSMRVNEMMTYMVNLGLFEQSNDTITCLKIAKFLDPKNTRNPEMQLIIRKAKGLQDSHDSIMIESKLSPDSLPTVSRQSPDSRGMSPPDKIRLDKNKTFVQADGLNSDLFDQFWTVWHNKKAKVAARKAFDKVIKSESNKGVFVDMLCNDIKKRIKSDQLGFAAMMPATYLNGRRWEDSLDRKEEQYDAFSSGVIY